MIKIVKDKDSTPCSFNNPDKNATTSDKTATSSPERHQPTIVSRNVLAEQRQEEAWGALLKLFIQHEMGNIPKSDTSTKNELSMLFL